MLAVLAPVLRKHDAILWLLGDGPLRTAAREAAGRSGLLAHVRCPGRLPRRDVPWILSHMQVALCASRSENSPHAIAEPMCAGLPVVSTDVGTASAFLRDFSTGFVITGSAKERSFGHAVDFLLTNQDVAREMGGRAREYGRAWLSWDECARNTAQMYSTILAF